MARVRLMDKPEDFTKLGINPDQVEPWEDGRRDSAAPGHAEVWYFDAILDDGSKVVVGFHPKSPDKVAGDVDTPRVGIVVTTPDGATYEDNWLYPADQARFGTEKCDVTAGPHSAVGDFTQYDVHIEPLNGIGASLHFEAVVKPYRQGTAVIALGDNDEFYYTDLSVPNNRVSGTITVNGAPREVTGFGYHDHQWMNIHQMQAWHHWLWGHLSTPDYTVLLYDFVASEQFGFTRVPLFGVMEHTTGDVIFSTDGHFTLDTTLERQEEIGKDFPKVSDYTFTNADGTSVELHIEWFQEIEIRDIYGKADEASRARFDMAHLKPAYVRYYATGTLTLAGPDGKPVTQTGEMIYEYPYLGVEDSRAHV